MKMNFSFLKIWLVSSLLVDSSLQQGQYNACDQVYQQNLLKAMNQKRAIHQAPPLILDNKSNSDELVKYSQEKANFFAGIRPYPPSSPKFPIGEIDFHYPLSNSSPESVVDKVYQTGNGYPYYGQEPPADWDRRKYEDFTTLIWAASRSVTLGCADAWDGPQSDRHITRHLVAIFMPPGNVVGQFAANVRSPSKK